MDATNYDNPQNRCPECRRSYDDITEVVSPQALVCPKCGRPIRGMSRRRLWTLFWTCFIGTPIAALPMASSPFAPLFGLVVVLGGILAAGFALSKLFARSIATFILMGFVFSLLVVVVYGGVAFAGCLVVMSRSNFK